MTPPEVSVVVATRDRPVLLARCLARLLQQATNRAYEVVVVNDGCPLPDDLTHDARVIILDTARRGPAASRNAGAERATGDVILFTDDDVLPDAGWLDAAAAALVNAPQAVGAEGPTDGGGFDLLFEHSIHNELPGAFFTCNVAYRRAEFLAVGGFDEGFPTPHCEDVDLGWRLVERGPILFVRDMRVVHPPRPMGFMELALRPRMIESEWRLQLKHPDKRAGTLPVRWTPLAGIMHRWRTRLLDPRVLRGSPRRLGRALALAIAQVLVATYTTLTRWRRIATSASTH